MVEIIENTEAAKPHVVVLLDESGSMSGQRSEVISTFNEYVDSVRETADTVSLYTFDSTGIRERIHRVPAKDSRKITEDDYSPNAMTPLFDAMGKVMKKFEGENKVQFVTHTDGMENHSTEFDYEKLKSYIDTQTNKGWLFVYLGEGIQGKSQVAQFAGLKVQFSAFNRSAAMKGLSDTTMSYSVGSNDLSRYTNAGDEIDVDNGQQVKTA